MPVPTPHSAGRGGRSTCHFSSQVRLRPMQLDSWCSFTDHADRISHRVTVPRSLGALGELRARADATFCQTGWSTPTATHPPVTAARAAKEHLLQRYACVKQNRIQLRDVLTFVTFCGVFNSNFRFSDLFYQSCKLKKIQIGSTHSKVLVIGSTHSKVLVKL